MAADEQPDIIYIFIVCVCESRRLIHLLKAQTKVATAAVLSSLLPIPSLPLNDLWKSPPLFKALHPPVLKIWDYKRTRAERDSGGVLCGSPFP